MNNNPFVRTIYLYLFALVGLILLIIGSVRFLDMVLKAFIFTQAEEEHRLSYMRPPMFPVGTPTIATESEDGVLESKETITLSTQEKANIDRWIQDYNAWVERRAQVDPITARRHRNASINLSMILIGLPLYFYHWGVIKRETRKKSG